MSVVDCFNPPDKNKNAHVMISNRPEIELPLDMNPQLHGLRVISCGPILLDSLPINEKDPEMQVWLARGVTVLVCHRTLVSYSEDAAKEMALALRTMLSRVFIAWGSEQ